MDLGSETLFFLSLVCLIFYTEDEILFMLWQSTALHDAHFLNEFLIEISLKIY